MVNVPAGTRTIPGGCDVPEQLTDPQAAAPRSTAHTCELTLVGANRTVTVFSWFADKE
jgi:hypothetical protein